MAESIRRHRDKPGYRADKIKAVLFDFGGVLAEEGFKKGLRAIAKLNGLDEEEFYEVGHDLVHTTGYVTGHADEHAYWCSVRDKSGITDDDTALRYEILSRFILRPWMLDIVKRLKAAGIKVAVLSDQTNWLDELNGRYGFFKDFDAIFNSFHLGKSKLDPTQFCDIIARMGVTAESVLFIDDTAAHCEAARRKGLHAIHFIEQGRFLRDLADYFPSVVELEP